MGIKVCHMTSVHKRYDGRIFQRECRTLHHLGFDVYLVVADEYPDEIKDGIRICSTGICANNRIERMTKASKSVYNRALEIDADVYHFHDPELLPYGAKLKKRGKKVIFDSHEDTVEQIIDKKYLLFPGLVSRIYGKYQSRIVALLDAVVVVSPNFIKRFETKARKVHVITNYPELKPMIHSDRTKKQICFTGGCSAMWCNEGIAEAVSELDCEYIMAGPGEKEYISYVLQKGNGHAKYLGLLSYEDSLLLQAESLAGAMVNNSTQLIHNGGTMGNTKMFEYMMNGLPIICSDVLLWRSVVEKHDCGICVDPYDVDSIRKGIRYLIENPDRAKQMGENGRKAVEKEYNWDTQKEIIDQLYNEILGV